MARSKGVANELVKCKYCGEMYSTTYKHCPFCDEDGKSRWEDKESEPGRKGGKRLPAGSLGGGGRNQPPIGTIILGLLSIALIVAAICIVVSIFQSITGRGEKDPPPSSSPSAPVTESQPVESQPTESQPTESQPAESEQPPAPTIPVVDPVKPTSFKLSREDMSFFKAGEYWDLKVTMEPADATAEVTWHSSDPNIASVSWNGRVVAVSKGTVNITASIEGVGEQTCIVRCRFDEGGGTAATPAPSDTSKPTNPDLSLSREDFTLAYVGDYWRLVVSGTNSTVTWRSTNSEVATVGADGTVTAVSKGTCKVIATVDGYELECIVRCNFKD